MSFIKNIQHRFKQGNIVEKLIYINIAVFIIGLLTSVFQNLYKTELNFIVQWFSLNANYTSFFSKPWSIISYGFLHADFLHILVNLITLFYIGNLFIEYFTQRQLLTFYILGTFFGGLLFMLSYNYFPLFENQNAILVGASAGISAIFIGVATYIPNYQLKIRFIGFMKLWHLATLWIVFDILALAGNNAGGHFSHLGGAIFGFLYVNRASNQKLNFFSKLSSFFSSKEKPLKTVYKSKKSTTNTVKNSPLNQKEIDIILDKIGTSGYDALSKEEKDFLFKQGKKQFLTKKEY